MVRQRNAFRGCNLQQHGHANTVVAAASPVKTLHHPDLLTQVSEARPCMSKSRTLPDEGPDFRGKLEHNNLNSVFLSAVHKAAF